MVCRTYDFGYLLKVVTCEALPEDEALFYELLHLYFPCIYDIKYLMKSCKNLRGGLQEVADTLAVRASAAQRPRLKCVSLMRRIVSRAGSRSSALGRSTRQGATAC